MLYLSENLKKYRVMKELTQENVAYQRSGDYDMAEKTYRDALLLYPNRAGLLLGLASNLALKGDTEEAIEFTE